MIPCLVLAESLAEDGEEDRDVIGSYILQHFQDAFLGSDSKDSCIPSLPRFPAPHPPPRTDPTKLLSLPTDAGRERLE